MGTGVGEAMLIGAAVGGGTSALTGGDPLKGAIIGAAGGGFGSALGAGFSAASAAPAVGSSTAASSFGSTLGAGTGAAGTGVGAAVTPGAFSGALPTTFAPVGTPLYGGASGITGVGTNVAAGAQPLGAISSALPTATTALPAVGGGAGFGGIGAGTGAGATGLGSVAGYTPGMYEGLAAAPTNAVSSVPFSTQTLTSANPPFSIRDLLNKAPTPDITGDSEAQRQVIKATGKNIFGYMPGDKGFLSDTTLAAIGGGSALLGRKDSTGLPGEEDYVSSFDPSKFRRSEPTYAPEGVYVPQYKTYAAEGGIMRLAIGGSVDDEMGGDYSAMGMDQGNLQKGLFGMGYAKGGIAGMLEDAKAQGLTPEAYQNIYGRGNKIVAMQKALKEGQIVDGMARGGVSSLGGYSDGGRMLKGPGDGMSDSIPGVIANKQPARLADGEFVIPADVVSHLGNGSTDAGAKQLYAMMDKVRKARTGKKKQAPAVKANRYMPA